MKKLLFILILFLFGPKMVFAAKYDDSFYAAEYIPNVFVNKVKNGESHYKQGRFMRSKTDDSIAYCVQPFEILSETIKYKSYDTEQYKKLGISKEEWNRISLIAYYGYGYGNHNSGKWYYVTQMMIWKVVDKNADFYFTDTLNGKKSSSYDDEIAEINTLVNNHTILPSFANNTYTYSIEKENVLVDTNGVLDSFEMKPEGSIEIKKENNSLVFSSPIKTIININFSKEIRKYNRPAIAFVDTKAQNILTPGNPEDIDFELTIKIESGKLKINKLDFDTSKKEPSGSGILIGTEYTLYNSSNEVVDILIIDENYQATSKELAFGTYVLKETKTMQGYLLDEEEYFIEINKSNLNLELSLKNKAIKSKLEIYKYYDDRLEEGISFEIYDINSNLIDTVTTDKYGKIEKELYYGKYIFHQLNTTKNYLKVEDFEVIIDENSPSVITLELYDEKFFSKLIILKVDSETGEIIKDEVIYNIYDVTNDEYITINNDKDLKADNGILVLDKLYAGNYIIEEKKAPVGYKKSDKKFEITIDEENEFKYDDNNYPIYEISVTNDKEVVEIKVPNTSQQYQLELHLFLDTRKKILKAKKS